MQLTRIVGPQRQALNLAAVSQSTWRHRHNRGHLLPNRNRSEFARIRHGSASPIEAEIATRITAGWELGHSRDHAFADAWDDGEMPGSRRSWWRIAAQIEAQSARRVAPTSRGSSRPPEGCAAAESDRSGAGLVLGHNGPAHPWRGVAFEAYSIIDTYSRKLVGYREDREVDVLAIDMFQGDRPRRVTSSVSKSPLTASARALSGARRAHIARPHK